MSYSSTPNRSLSNEEYLQQRLGKITLDNELQDEMLYVRNDDLQQSSENYDPQMDPMGGNWDYSTPQTRNLDAIITDLTPEEVRWFYKSEGEKRWLEFSGYDSLRIELEYRKMYDPSMKYSQYSAFSDHTSGPSGSHYGVPGSSSHFGSSSIRFPSKQPANQYSQQLGRYGEPQQLGHKIVVRGGLYDVNFETWKCASIYWPGEECQITRGTWFYEGSWQPLEREQSSILESKHLSMFQGHKLSEYTENENKGTVMHTETFPEFTVEWFSPNQIYLYSENKPSKIVRSVTTRLGFSKSTGYRLFRGYKTEASLSDRPDVEITHLVFVIHGIGQKMDTGRIIRNTSRDCVQWLKQKYFSNFPNHRAEFFPVEWRSNLQLDGELVDAITPNTLQSLRQMLNASAMDIMYYTSPLYGGEVQRGLREELNRLYSMFSARNPYFINKGGKISVIAHSLGCVILYDIIMGLKPGSLVPNTQQGLLFQIQNFFCLGSPLSVFLALRWKDSQIPGKMDIILPQRLCHRLYNVFHPTDPVAYRIEPLLVKDYHRIAPLVIQPYNATFHTPYSEMPLEILVPEQQQQQQGGQYPGAGPITSNLTHKEEFSPGGTPKDKTWSIWGLRNKNTRKSTDGTQLEPFQEGLDYRLDYILRESNLGVSYLSALTSHTAYWTNYDIAYFILTQIFPEFERYDPTKHADKSYTDKFSSYSQNYTTDLQYGSMTENRNYSSYDDPTSRNLDRSSNFPPQNLDSHRQNFPGSHPSDNFNQPRYQTPNFPDRQQQQQQQQQQSIQDFSHSSQNYPSNVGPHQQNFPSQNIPPHSLGMDHQNFPQHSMGPQHNFPPTSGQQQPPLQQQNYQGQPPHGPQQQNFPPFSGPQSQNFSQQPHSYQNQPPHMQPQPHQQQPIQHPQQLPLHLQQQQQQPPHLPPQNFQHPQNYQQLPPHQQPPHMQPPNYQQPQNYQQQPQNFQQQPAQSLQANQIISGLTKNIQTKTGFFDKITEDKNKSQSATSPTKSTKSFFPSFNLSSLTSPVKNLSNSLSNISNQMTNIASNKDSVSNNSNNTQNRSPASFLGSITQSKNVPQQNYNQPNRNQQSPQIAFNQALTGPNQFQQINPSPNQYLNQNQQQGVIRSSSPYDKQIAQMGIRSSSPVSLQNRCSPMQYGPIETPVGAIKPKTIRIQPKIPNYDQRNQYGYDSTNISNKNRCVSPLGQSKVVCSGNRNSLAGGYNNNNNLALGARSLSSGNLRNSTLVSGTYPGSRSNVSSTLNQTSYLSTTSTGLNRRTMSRPNLSSTGSGLAMSSNTGLGMSSNTGLGMSSNSGLGMSGNAGLGMSSNTGLGMSSSTGLGMSSLVYNSSYGGTGTRSYINRDYSGPSSR